LLVYELLITLLDISDLYGVRYFNYDMYVFQFEQTFRHFRAPARAPTTEPGPGAAYPLTRLLSTQLIVSLCMQQFKKKMQKTQEF